MIRLAAKDNSDEFAAALMAACGDVGRAVEARGEMPTMNDLVGALIAVAAFHIAGIEEAHIRKALLREMERELPRAVARQRTAEGGVNRGRVVTVYKGMAN